MAADDDDTVNRAKDGQQSCLNYKIPCTLWQLSLGSNGIRLLLNMLP